MAANGLKTNIYRFFKPLAAIQFWLVQLLIPETCVMAFELLYLAKILAILFQKLAKTGGLEWLSHYNCRAPAPNLTCPLLGIHFPISSRNRSRVVSLHTSFRQ